MGKVIEGFKQSTKEANDASKQFHKQIKEKTSVANVKKQEKALRADAKKIRTAGDSLEMTGKVVESIFGNIPTYKREE